MQLTKKVRRIVKEACFHKENKFSHTVWAYHILPVVEHSLKLGKKLGADLEALELAAYLHDYAGLLDYKLYKEHHVHSARLAEKILRKNGYPPDKIKIVSECILSHRGSRHDHKICLEARILASADGMSHITELADMFYLTFGVHGYYTREGAEWLGKKLARSWKKIMPVGRKMVAAEYRIAQAIIDKTLLRKYKNA